jgi:hypothetical protein
MSAGDFTVRKITGRIKRLMCLLVNADRRDKSDLAFVQRLFQRRPYRRRDGTEITLNLPLTSTVTKVSFTAVIVPSVKTGVNSTDLFKVRISFRHYLPSLRSTNC